MKRIRKFVRNFVFTNNTDSDLFYGKYQGGQKLSVLKKFLIIFLDIRSLIDYFLYHNNALVLNTFGKSKKIKKNFYLNRREQEVLKKLQEDGIVFLDGYFEHIADQMIEENIFEDKESDHSYIQNSEIKQNKPLFDILNDRSLIKIASKYYGVKSYFRYRPTANLTYPKRDDITSRQRFDNQSLEFGDFADEWHVDSVYNLQYHILLKDTDKNQTRMFFAKGEKVSFFDRFCGFASDEYVNKEFDIIELCGKKGTVILFDGSKHWHRLYPVKGKKRYTSSVLFTRGQQPCDPDMYVNKLSLDNLDEKNKEDFKYII